VHQHVKASRQNRGLIVDVAVHDSARLPWIARLVFELA